MTQNPIAAAQGTLRSWGALLAVVALALSPGAASALSVEFDLAVEFDSGEEAEYAHVTVDENAGNLDFSIELTPVLGEEADLHEFYFNLVSAPGGDDFTGVAISTTDNPSKAYTLSSPATVDGGAGAGFDYEVNFGDGASAQNGNGVLGFATFTLSAAQALSIEDLYRESSFAQGGSIEANVAAHIQGTDFVSNTDSETVGGLVPMPEAETGVLLGLGLAGLVAFNPKGRSHARSARSSR